MRESARVRARLVQLGGVGAFGGLATWLLLVAFDRSVRPWLVLALAIGGAVVAALVVVAFEAQPVPVTPARRAIDDGPVPTGTRFTAERESLERRLDAAMTDTTRFERILHPLLTDLVIQRLRARRNLDARTDDARRLLGDDLWRMTISSAPLPTLPTRQQLTEWIGRIEAI